MKPPRSHPPSPARRGMALVCALAVWLLGVLGTSAQLHGALHDEAGQAGHTCAVTLFREGHADSLGQAELIVAPAFFPAGEFAPLQAAPAADAAVRLPPGCGPPTC